MNVVVVKTNIQTRQKVLAMEPVFNIHVAINHWSIDIEDKDNVLRIEADDRLNEQEVIHLVRSCGFNCEIMAD